MYKLHVLLSVLGTFREFVIGTWLRTKVASSTYIDLYCIKMCKLQRMSELILLSSCFTRNTEVFV